MHIIKHYSCCWLLLVVECFGFVIYQGQIILYNLCHMIFVTYHMSYVI
jgi:hypothetical protein